MSGVDPFSMLQGGLALAGGAMERSAAYKASAIDEENARRALYQGELDAQDIMRAERRAAGEALAQMAGSGVMIGSGTPRDILEQSLLQSELDIQRARAAAIGEARNHQIAGAEKRAAGRAAMTASMFSAVSGAIKGASDKREARLRRESNGRVDEVRLGRTGGGSTAPKDPRNRKKGG